MPKPKQFRRVGETYTSPLPDEGECITTRHHEEIGTADGYNEWAKEMGQKITDAINEVQRESVGIEAVTVIIEGADGADAVLHVRSGITIVPERQPLMDDTVASYQSHIRIMKAHLA